MWVDVVVLPVFAAARIITKLCLSVSGRPGEVSTVFTRVLERRRCGQRGSVEEWCLCVFLTLCISPEAFPLASIFCLLMNSL